MMKRKNVWTKITCQLCRDKFTIYKTALKYKKKNWNFRGIFCSDCYGYAQTVFNRRIRRGDAATLKKRKPSKREIINLIKGCKRHFSEEGKKRKEHLMKQYKIKIEEVK